MKTSVIRQRAADFLSRHAPFDAFSEHDLLELAGSGRVRFHQAGESIFRQADAKEQFIWVIQQGRVDILEEGPSGTQLRDVLGPGDLLGLGKYSGNGRVTYSARTASDVILYSVAAELFDSLLPGYPAVSRFLSAHVSVSGILGFDRSSWLEAEVPSIEFFQARLVTIGEQTCFADAVSAVSRARNGVATVVDHEKRPVGILTALDLCGSAVGNSDNFARPCPPAIGAPLSTRTAVREMLRTRSEVLAITADGTSGSALQAVVTAADLELFCGHNPVRLTNDIRQAGSIEEAATLLRQAMRFVSAALAQPQDVDDCRSIGSEVSAALLDFCISLARCDLLAEGAAFDIPYCWVMLGHAARGDLLCPRLPLLVLIYDDSADSADRTWFAALVERTIDRLQACGLAGSGFGWPKGAQPSMSIAEWKRYYGAIIRNPIGNNLYACREFFDAVPFSGDASILSGLQTAIQLDLHEHETVIPLLANDTLANLPPLTFFKGLVFDFDGTERDGLDIFETVVSPVTGAARVFALARRRFTPAGTLERLEAAAGDFPDGARIFKEAMEAFRLALYYQTLAGSPRLDSARLSKYDQRLLTTTFASVQRLLEFTVSTFIPGE